MEVEKGSDLYYTKDGLTTFYGLEFSGAYQFTDKFMLGLGVIHLDATIDEVSAENAAIEGNTPSYAADWQFVTNAEYENAFIEGLKLHGNIRYYGDSFTDDSNALEVPDRTVINAGISYSFELSHQQLVINGNINNLLNEKYWAGGGWSAGNVGEERNISVNVEFKL
jgi:iron complex outermembrane recepter protein